jgi:hypothetical protein
MNFYSGDNGIFIVPINDLIHHLGRKIGNIKNISGKPYDGKLSRMVWERLFILTE